MGNSLPSKWFKTTNCKILHFYFSDFFRQLVTKIMGKTAIWAISYFYPLPSLNNVEKKRAKLASSYVMGSQRCKGEKEGFLNIVFKIPIIFCHWLWFSFITSGMELYYYHQKPEVRVTSWVAERLETFRKSQNWMPSA